MITYIADTSDEEEDMAPRTGPSLKELMKGRNKGPSPQDKGKSKQTTHPPPPPPQVPADLGLKPRSEEEEASGAYRGGGVRPIKGQ